MFVNLGKFIKPPVFFPIRRARQRYVYLSTLEEKILYQVIYLTKVYFMTFFMLIVLVNRFISSYLLLIKVDLFIKQTISHNCVCIDSNMHTILTDLYWHIAG